MRARFLFPSLVVAALLAACGDASRQVAPKRGVAHVPSFATGTSASGATLTTDRDDYSPGQTLNLTGAGWQAGDSLDVVLDEEPQNHPPVTWAIGVDANGAVSDATYVVQESDLGVTFTIKATSRVNPSETVTATFTDASPAPLSPILYTGNGTTAGVCNTFQDDPNMNPGPGQQGWQFNMNNGDPAFSTSSLTALFSDNVVPQVIAGTVQGGGYRYIAYTAAGATLTSASATNGMTNSTLTVGHCELYAPTVTQALALTGSKTAAGAYDKTYAWTIKKEVDKTLVKQVGGSVTFNYTVTVTKDAGTNSNIKVTGSVAVNNPNASAFAITVSDVLTGATCTFDNGAPTSAAPGPNSFAYTCTGLASVPVGAVNHATVNWIEQTVGTEHLAAGSVDLYSSAIVFTATEIDASADVTDTYDGVTTVLGNDITAGTTYPYTHAITVPSYGCVSKVNKASLTRSTTAAVLNSDQITVTVCGPVRTGALTIGYWQNKNGQDIIKTGASTAGTCNSGTWLRTFVPFQDLSATATCTQVAAYVTTIIKAANASGAAMNAMLKAQMLATALDVYFSDAALGGNKIGAPGPIGAVTIDLTQICKNIATCSIYENVSSAFGGNSRTVLQMLADAAGNTLNAGGTALPAPGWYGQVKATQELAKDAFDAVNNQVAFAP